MKLELPTPDLPTITAPLVPVPAPPWRPRLGAAIRALYVALLLLGDVCAVLGAFVVAYQVHVIAQPRPGQVGELGEYIRSLLILELCLLGTYALSNLYVPRRGWSHVENLAAICKATLLGAVFAMAASALLLRSLTIPQNILVYAVVLTIAFVWLSRTVLGELLRFARRRGWDTERVIIVGVGEDGRTIREKINADPGLGYWVAGFVDDDPAGRGDAREGLDPPHVALLGSIDDLPDLLRKYQVRQVIVARPGLPHSKILDIVEMCDRERCNVQVFPDYFQIVVREVGASEFGGLPMLRVRDVSLRGWNLWVKRAMDVVIAAAILVALAPMLMVIALLIKLTSPGPVFFVQTRVGIDGREFPCIKFRSMRVDAERETGPVWARPDDDRTTAIGRFLRRYSLDEFPQLVNVLMGDMSLVGPRPERPHFVAQFTRLIPRYGRRHQEKAGVTGWAQVNGLRGQTSIEERTRHDLFYVEHWSPTFDLKILLKTIAAVVRGRNAY